MSSFYSLGLVTGSSALKYRFQNEQGTILSHSNSMVVLAPEGWAGYPQRDRSVSLTALETDTVGVVLQAKIRAWSQKVSVNDKASAQSLDYFGHLI